MLFRSNGILPTKLLAMGLEAVEFRLVVRCRDANVEPKNPDSEDEPIGPETDRLLDATESLLARTAIWLGMDPPCEKLSYLTSKEGPGLP